MKKFLYLTAALALWTLGQPVRAAAQQPLADASRSPEAAHKPRLESLRRAVEERILKDAEKGYGSFKKIPELDRDPAREKIR